MNHVGEIVRPIERESQLVDLTSPLHSLSPETHAHEQHLTVIFLLNSISAHALKNKDKRGDVK